MGAIGASRTVLPPDSRVKIYAICLIKNEGDVIADCLIHALTFCDRIFVLDNGSTDGTWETVNALAQHYPTIVIEDQLLIPFRDGMRSIVYNKYNHELADQDWWLRLDGDEFLEGDPREVLATANCEQADFVTAWNLQFYYTDADYKNWAAEKLEPHRPITERRLYYSANWREYRFFRNQPHQPWNEAVAPQWPNGLTKACSQRLYNRHYPYRTPDQIKEKLQARYGHEQFRHIDSVDWTSKLLPARQLNHFQEGQPPIINQFDYYAKRLRMIRITLMGRIWAVLRRLLGGHRSSHTS